MDVSMIASDAQFFAPFEMGCGEGSVPGSPGDIGALWDMAGGAELVQIGDIYDDISTMHGEVVHQIEDDFGVKLTAAEFADMQAHFARVQEVAKTSWVWQAVGDCHQVAIGIMKRARGPTWPATVQHKAESDALNATMQRISQHMTDAGGGGGHGLWSGIGNAVGSALPVVLGAAGGIVGGIVAVATFGAGTPLIPFLVAGGAALGTAVGAGGTAIAKNALDGSAPAAGSRSLPVASASAIRGGVVMQVNPGFFAPIAPVGVASAGGAAARRAAMSTVSVRSGPSAALANVPVPVVSGGMSRMAVESPSAPMSPQAKTVVAVTGVGALGLIGFLAWRGFT